MCSVDLLALLAVPDGANVIHSFEIGFIVPNGSVIHISMTV